MTSNEIAARRLQEEKRSNLEQEKIGRARVITDAVTGGLSALARVNPSNWVSHTSVDAGKSVPAVVRSLKRYGFSRSRNTRGGQ